MAEEEGKKSWDVPDFERHPKLELKRKGDSATVKFLDDGNSVSADVLSRVLKEKGIKGVKPRDSIVFTVEQEGEKMEYWMGASNYTSLRELKAIAKENKDTLVNAEVLIERIAEGIPDEPNFKHTKAE